ncbi:MULTISPECIES: DUF6153 family protein [Arthrobacter]|uniref:Uncharacterized protein n=1 Tax=Arthrobacter terricola TaxID=2547396 RepID=A0A4R5KWL5_9MICC|nr:MULTISPECIES: DUF6153 family protein [Arthrobacter]MBT8160378.1 hypothetical protein [Arthrobacter sp. GN70]TDF99932.1 hypothetical protein E1809_04435 [Arthrobacter terricola]
MTDPRRRRSPAFLRRVGLFATLLSVVAGILGMHVLSPGHGTHTVGTGHGIIAHADHHEQTAMAGHSCESPGTCTAMSAGAGTCVPAPSHTTLAAPLPGVLAFVTEPAGSMAAGISRYPHRPESPSPGDLCISRT